MITIINIRSNFLYNKLITLMLECLFYKSNLLKDWKQDVTMEVSKKHNIDIIRLALMIKHYVIATLIGGFYYG